jgi:predicted peptidase
MQISSHIQEHKLPFMLFEHLPNARKNLVISVHGKGEVGPSDGSALSRILSPNTFAKHAATYEFDFDIAAPQILYWNHKDLTSFVNFMGLKYGYKKVFITGLSGGGEVTWKQLQESFTGIELVGIAPVAAHWKEGIPIACSLKSVPTFCYHNTGDPTIPYANEVKLIDAIRACGPRDYYPVMTSYQSNSHDAWTAAYKVDGDLHNRIRKIFGAQVPIKDNVIECFHDGTNLVFKTQSGKTHFVAPSKDNY